MSPLAGATVLVGAGVEAAAAVSPLAGATVLVVAGVAVSAGAGVSLLRGSACGVTVAAGPVLEGAGDAGAVAVSLAGGEVAGVDTGAPWEPGPDAPQPPTSAAAATKTAAVAMPTT